MAESEGNYVVDRKEKLGLVDSIQSGLADANQIVDPSNNSSQLVVSTNLDS
jgi:hypothetical protein